MAKNHKLIGRQARARRVRSALNKASDRPRLSVNVSLQHVSAQVIDDKAAVTMVASSSRGLKVTGSKTDKAVAVGKDIAQKAITKKIKAVNFDRGGRLYHGRIKALAEAARAAGLEF